MVQDVASPLSYESSTFEMRLLKRSAGAICLSRLFVAGLFFWAFTRFLVVERSGSGKNIFANESEVLKKMDATPEPLDVTLVVPGGACGAAYTTTGVALLLELERAGLVRVRAYYTTSAGSVLCAAALCCAPTMLERCLDLFAALRDRRSTHWLVETVASVADAALPADAHVTCTDRLVISLTRGTRRETVRAYETRDALVRAIVDSCRLPFVTAPAWCVLDRHDGYLAPSPAAEAGAVVTLPYPPAWATLRMTMPVVWWATWLFASPCDATTLCGAMHEGVARARARIALAVPVPVPPEVVARTHAAVDSAQRAFLAKSGLL
jgi:hypothetical protein